MNISINDLLETIGEQAKQIAILNAQVKAYEREKEEKEVTEE